MSACISVYTYLSGQVLEDGRAVDGGSCSDTAVAGGPGLEMPVDTTHGELQASTGRSTQNSKFKNIILVAYIATFSGILRDK